MPSARNPELVAFGARARDARKALGRTVMEQAVEMGMHPSQLSAIERGEKDCQLTTLMRLAVALNVAPGELIGSATPETVERSQSEKLAASRRRVRIQGRTHRETKGIARGGRLYAQREISGLTQAQAAERANMPIRTLQNLERDPAANPKIRDLIALAAVYGCELDDLIENAWRTGRSGG